MVPVHRAPLSVSAFVGAKVKSSVSGTSHVALAEGSDSVQGFPQLQHRHWNGLGHKCRCQLWLVSQQVGDNKALGIEFHALIREFVVGNQQVSPDHLENCVYFLKKYS